MIKKYGYYGFRGNIEFKSLDLFNYNLEQNSAEKNKIFHSFFKELKEKKLDSDYEKREYILIYIKDLTPNIIHCQLARRRNYSSYELENYRIEQKTNKDYPYVNVFIDIKSQKFLIESKTKTFANPETCKKTIENIMSNALNLKNAYITVNPITSEDKFWQRVESSKKVLSLEFDLNTPNWLDSENSATNLMRAIRENTGADRAKIEFSNVKEGLDLNREGIDSFVEYSTEGAGKWRMKYEDEHTGEKTILRSDRTSKIIYIELDEDYEQWENNSIIVVNVKRAFNQIEKFEKFRSE